MRSSAVTPTVHPRRVAWPTIWSMVWMLFGRRTRGIDSMSSTDLSSFMPMGGTFSLSMPSSSAANSASVLVSTAFTSGFLSVMMRIPVA